MCRLQTFKRLRQEREVLFHLSKIGIEKSKVEESTEDFDRLPKKGQEYYYYLGPLDEKTRPFCKKMLEMGKVFSKAEIDKLSKYLKYDVLEFVGAYNCRHQWVRFRGKEINSAPPTVKQINDLIRAGVKVTTK